MLKRCVVLLCVLSCQFAFAAPPAKDPGKPIADDAAVAFKEGRFIEAAELFEKAYALGNDKFVRLRNAGRAWEEAGKLEYARTQFQKYLDKVRSGPEHDEVQDRLARLEERMRAPTKPEPAKPEPPAVAPDPTQPEVASPAATSERRDGIAAEGAAIESGVVQPLTDRGKPAWVAWTLVGTGAAFVAGGATWLVLTEVANARVADEKAQGLYSVQKEADDRATITRNRAGAAVVAGVGVVGVTVGAIWLAQGRQAPQVAPVLLPGGAAVAWQGQF